MYSTFVPGMQMYIHFCKEILLSVTITLTVIIENYVSKTAYTVYIEILTVY